MEKATVYYTDFRVHAGTNLQEKLEKLIKAAGIGQIDMDGKFVVSRSTSGNRATWPSCAPTGPGRWPTW